MELQIRYPAKFTEAPEGGYCVEFPDVPGALTQGDTLEEALFNAAEALTGILEARLEHGLEIAPPSTDLKGKHVQYIAPDAKTQAALLVRTARGERKMADLARALGKSWPQTQRLENPGHWPSLRTLERAAHALGKRLVLSFV